MADPLIEVAKAIVDDLNADPGGNFGTGFTAVRSYAEWEIALRDVGELKVDVVPVAYLLNEMADRNGTLLYQVAVHIGVRKRLRRDSDTTRFDLAEVDDLVQLTRRLSDWFASDSGRPHELAAYPQAMWIAEGVKNNRSEILQTCDKKMLRTGGQYTGVIQVLYEVQAVPA